MAFIEPGDDGANRFGIQSIVVADSITVKRHLGWLFIVFHSPLSIERTALAHEFAFAAVFSLVNEAVATDGAAGAMVYRKGLVYCCIHAGGISFQFRHPV